MAHSKRGKLTYFSDIDELKEDFLDHIEVIGNIHDKNKQKKPGHYRAFFNIILFSLHSQHPIPYAHMRLDIFRL